MINFNEFLKAVKKLDTKAYIHARRKNKLYSICKELGIDPPNDYKNMNDNDVVNFIVSFAREKMMIPVTTMTMTTIHLNQIKSFGMTPDGLKKRIKMGGGFDKFNKLLSKHNLFIDPGSKHSKFNKQWLSFDDVRKIIIEKNIKSQVDYLNKRTTGILSPDIFPSNPDHTYKNEWLGWEYFCGREKMSDFVSMIEAQKIITPLNIKSLPEYKKKYESGLIPKNLPKSPDQYYRRVEPDWKGTPHFFGKSKPTYIKFEEAIQLMKKLSIQSPHEFNEKYESGIIPDNVPKRPAITYKRGWRGWGHFLGLSYYRYDKRDYVLFEEAKALVIKAAPRNMNDFLKMRREGILPLSIPSLPYEIYKSEWGGWPNFLRGQEKIEWMSFLEAIKFLAPLHIKNKKEFYEKRKTGVIPKSIPTVPHKTYKYKGWINWEHFITKEKFLSHEEARKLMLVLEIRNRDDFQQKRKSGIIPPSAVPGNPASTYKNFGWVSWDHFLGKQNLQSRRFIKNLTKEQCIEDAQKYTNPSDWRKNSEKIYMKAHKHGWLEDCTKHMTRLCHPVGWWTKERCIEDAKNYSYRSEWRKESSSAYTAAYKNGWLEECCKHMKVIPNNFHKKAA